MATNGRGGSYGVDMKTDVLWIHTGSKNHQYIGFNATLIGGREGRSFGVSGMLSVYLSNGPSSRE